MGVEVTLDEKPQSATPARGRGRGRAKTSRASTSTRARGRGRAAATASSSRAQDEDEAEITLISDSEDMIPATSKPTPRNPASKSRAASTLRGGAIAQAFARQSQQATSSATTVKKSPSTVRKASNRGVCYISDSDWKDVPHGVIHPVTFLCLFVTCFEWLNSCLFVCFNLVMPCLVLRSFFEEIKRGTSFQLIHKEMDTIQLCRWLPWLLVGQCGCMAWAR